MQDAKEELEAAGVGILGISSAAAHQAQWLAEEKGISYPLLLDPDDNLRTVLSFKTMGMWRYLLPNTWWNYVKGFRRGSQGAITAAPNVLPGVLIVDAQGILRYRHEGKTLGDYPKVRDVVAAARSLQR